MVNKLQSILCVSLIFFFTDKQVASKMISRPRHTQEIVRIKVKRFF